MDISLLLFLLLSIIFNNNLLLIENLKCCQWLDIYILIISEHQR